MVGQVFKDMSFFLVVFFVLVLAFGDAFYTEANAQTEDNFIENWTDALLFSYINAIGDFDTENFHGSLPWILFFICTIFNLIVLLNLLIAIISDTYETVTATKEQYAMLQKVQVIANCRDFKFFPRRKRAPCDYLFIAKNVTADGNEDVRAPEVYKEATQLRDKMKAVLN